MSRRKSILALIVAIGLAGACAQQEEAKDPAEEAFSALRTALSEAETSEAKATLTEDYLARFPDTERSGWAAGAIVNYRGHDMEDPQGAYDAVSAALGQIEDPEQRFEVSMELLSLADSVEVPLDVAEVAGAIEAVWPLTFDEHQCVEISTPEQLRADHPDREFTDVQTAQMVGLRKATSLAYEGWAAYNMGDTELADDRFTAADEVDCVNYLGVPKTPLYTFWGRAALGEGDFDRAVELLGANMLFGGDGSGAEPYLREAYVAKNGDDEGFGEFLWATRNKLATSVDDFTLLDYDGNEVNLAEVSAGKVTLLAFWFPT
jgi:hypothetical protein